MICAAVATALDGRADYPEEVRDDPCIKRYTAESNNLKGDLEDEILIAKYIQHKKANSGSQWHVTVNQFLVKALNHMGTVQHATKPQLMDFLDAIADRTSPATRNRAHASLSGFYRYLREIGFHPESHNPMKKIKHIPEERPPEGIITWEANEIPPCSIMPENVKMG